MVLDWMHVHNFHEQTVAGGENVVIFGVDIVLLCMLIIKKRYLSSW